MKHQYRCDSCGCYLDPGEGLLCDECREMVRMRIRGIDNIKKSIRLLYESLPDSYKLLLELGEDI